MSIPLWINGQGQIANNKRAPVILNGNEQVAGAVDNGGGKDAAKTEVEIVTSGGVVASAIDLLVT